MCTTQGEEGLAPGLSHSDNDDATGTEGLLMANGDDGTFAEDLQHSRQQPLNGMRAQRSRRQLSSEGARHAGHSFKATTRLTASLVTVAGVSVAPRWLLHCMA